MKTLVVPLNLNTDLYPKLYAADARIHSDSWGSTAVSAPSGAYTSRAQEIDQFMWEHKVCMYGVK